MFEQARKLVFVVDCGRLSARSAAGRFCADKGPVFHSGSRTFSGPHCDASKLRQQKKSLCLAATQCDFSCNSTPDTFECQAGYCQPSPCDATGACVTGFVCSQDTTNRQCVCKWRTTGLQPEQGPQFICRTSLASWRASSGNKKAQQNSKGSSPRKTSLLRILGPFENRNAFGSSLFVRLIANERQHRDT